MAVSRLKAIDFSPLLESISSSISTWTASTLSYAGRLELIRAIIQGKACYWLTMFSIPYSVIYQIQRLCSIFLWGSKVARVTWDDTCFPKNEGGLGLQNLKTWNKALLAKELWNIHKKKENLWIQWVHSIYLTDSDIWGWKPPKDTPPFLKAITDIRDLMINQNGSKLEAIKMMENCTKCDNLDNSLIYDLLRTKRDGLKWSKVIWSPTNLPKHSFHFWLCMLGDFVLKTGLVTFISTKPAIFVRRNLRIRIIFFSHVNSVMRCGFISESGSGSLEASLAFTVLLIGYREQNSSLVGEVD